MVLIQTGVPLVLGAFAAICVVLVVVALLAVLWTRAGFFLIATVLRAAYRMGLYDPDRETTTTQPDRGIVLFSRALRSVSRLVPGDPGTHQRTIIVPVVLLGVPVTILALIFLWAVPMFLVGYVVTYGPSQWSTLLAGATLGGYFCLFLVVWRLWRRNRFPVPAA